MSRISKVMPVYKEEMVYPCVTSFKQVIVWGKVSYLLKKNHENPKHQNPNIKQIPMTKTQNSKQAQ
jgi:hypothetical protein